MKRALSLMLAVVMLFVPATVSMAAENTSAVPYTESDGVQVAYPDAVYDTQENSAADLSASVVWTVEDPGNILEVNWKELSDEELTDVINHSTDEQVAMFLYSLTEEELYDVIERETTLKYPVMQYTDTDEYEITADGLVRKQKVEILAEHYYEYALNSMVSLLSWTDSTGRYEGTASGYFYFKIKKDGQTLTNLTVKVTNITAGGSMSGKYTITGTAGDWKTTSVTSEKQNNVWAGVVLNGTYKKHAHYYTLWSSAGHGLGRYDPWNSNYTDYTLDYTHAAYDTTDSVRIQVNGCNIGLVAGYTGYHATGTISLVKYDNALKINPNGGVHGGKSTTYTLATKVCESTTEVANPTRAGYEFTGWTVSNGSGAAGSLSGTTFTHCNKGATFSTDTDVYSNTTVTTTLKANWVAKNYPYEVRHYKQLLDGTYLGTPDETETGVAGNDTSFTGAVKTYSGYISPAPQTITIKNGSNVISYYYEKSDFNLTVDPNGGTWRGNLKPSVLQIANGSSEVIEDPIAPVGAKVTLNYHDDVGTVVTEDVQKVFSHWTKSGGGEFDSSTKLFTSKKGDAALTATYTGGTFTLPVLSREHYTFIGWDTDPDIDPDVENPDYQPGATIPVDADLELHAIWKVDFELDAHIERVLPPNDPVFENGEMGVLKISLVGFVNRVEVTFPYEMTRYDDTLTMTHTMTPKLLDDITQEFYVPLYSAEGGYRVRVTAYNEEGDSLTVYPGLTIYGTILDDFRTRLR